MQKIFRNYFFHNHLVQWLVIFIIFLNIISWVSLLIAIPRSDDPILLHYNAYIGLELDSISPWQAVYWIPGISFLLALAHIIAGYIYYQRQERIVTHVLLLSAALIQIAAVIASASVILVNRV
jgi:hypothetical protein